MVYAGLVLLGVVWTLGSLYLAARAEPDFELGMAMQGVDPDGVTRRSREQGVRRNRLAGFASAVMGLGFVVWGLVA